MAKLSLSVKVGDHDVTVYGDDIRDIIRISTALREFDSDVKLLKSLGARNVTWQHRKSTGKDNRTFDYYDLVGDNGLKISAGTYNPPESGPIALFPGGWLKLYNPSVDSQADPEITEEQKASLNEFMASTGNAIVAAESYHKAKIAAENAYKRAASWPSSWRTMLHNDFVRKAFELRRQQ